MRICFNVIKEGKPSITETDIELALHDVWASWEHEWAIEEQGDGCFTADTTEEISAPSDFEAKLMKAVKDATGGTVRVEVFEGFPPPGWGP